MIQMRTNLDAADNSGAKRLQCIKVLGGSRRKYASLGDVIVVSIKEALPTSKVKKGSVAKAVIVRTKKNVPRADGTYIKFDTNSAVLIDDALEPLAHGCQCGGPQCFSGPGPGAATQAGLLGIPVPAFQRRGAGEFR